MTEDTAWRTLSKVSSPTNGIQAGDTIRFKRGCIWRADYTGNLSASQLQVRSGLAGKHTTYTDYGSQDLSKPSILFSISLNKTADWVLMDGLWRTATPLINSLQWWVSDAGNILFDGHIVSYKKWSKEDLQKDRDFWFDKDLFYVWVKSSDNPAIVYNEVEVCLGRGVGVNLAEAKHVTISNLDLRYNASHAIFGHDCENITIRNVDISWIGGGEQFSFDTPQVRFGNGIEFWNNASDCLVENCTIHEVYDHAISLEGSRATQYEKKRITCRNNTARNCESVFTPMVHGADLTFENIIFENNTMISSGFGWGRYPEQRPDDFASSNLFLSGSVTFSENFIIRNNISIGSRVALNRFYIFEALRILTEFDNNIYSQQLSAGSCIAKIKLYGSVHFDAYDWLVYLKFLKYFFPEKNFEKNSVFDGFDNHYLKDLNISVEGEITKYANVSSLTNFIDGDFFEELWDLPDNDPQVSIQIDATSSTMGRISLFRRYPSAKTGEVGSGRTIPNRISFTNFENENDYIDMTLKKVSSGTTHIAFGWNTALGEISDLNATLRIINMQK